MRFSAIPLKLRKEREVKRVLVAAVLLAASGLPALAETSSGMDCSHYMAMNAAGQMTTVNSMRSRMSAANKMPSSHEMAKKVSASCKDHPGMMVHEVMENVMPLTSVMPH
jgi:hypothetical protein